MSDYEVKGLFFWGKLDKDKLSNADLEKIVCSDNGQAVKEKAAHLWLERLAKEKEDLGEDYRYDNFVYDEFQAWCDIIANVESLKEQMSKLILGKKAYEEIYENYEVVLKYGDSASKIKLAKEIVGYSLSDGEEYFWLALHYVPDIAEEAFGRVVKMYESGEWYGVVDYVHSNYSNWNFFIDIESDILALRAVDFYLEKIGEYQGFKALTLLKIMSRFPNKVKKVVDIFISKFKKFNINDVYIKKLSEKILDVFPELESKIRKLEKSIIKSNEYYLARLLVVGKRRKNKK